MTKKELKISSRRQGEIIMHTVLVVDDEKIVGTAFKRELVKEGYDVDTSSDGKTAIEMAKSKNYDIVFMDLVMPGMDGIETCKIMKEISPDSTIIFMTGNIDNDTTWKEIEFVRSGGKIYYLYKPFVEGEILRITHEALAEKNREPIASD